MKLELVKSHSINDVIMNLFVKKPFVGYFVVIILTIVVTLGVTSLTDNPNKTIEDDIPENVKLMRTALEQRTTYDGVWAREEEGLVEVYLPGEELDEREYNSAAVTAERDYDYDGGLKKAFGMYTSDVKLECDIEDDPEGILNLVINNVISDIGNACRAGNPIGTYEVSYEQLADGRMAMFISGNIEMTQVYQKSKTDKETFEEQVNYPILAYVTLEKGYPVALWCTYEYFDGFAPDEAPKELEEMLYTLWQTKFTGEDVEWTTVPTYLDSNRTLRVEQSYLDEQERKNNQKQYGEDGQELPDAPKSGTYSEINGVESEDE